MKKLATLKPGTFFCYGGVQWVTLENDKENGAALAISAAPVFNAAFDDDNKNDWRESSVRVELNGPFLDRLIQAGANPADFLEWESDLTADDGMTDYGTATDKIALLSDGLYRKFRQFIPAVDEWCWTLTPWTCKPEYAAFVRSVLSSGALGNFSAYYGGRGVRPLCYLNSEILVSVTYEEECADPHADAVEEANSAIMYVLEQYPTDVWGDAIAAVVASLFRANQEAGEIAQEEAAARALNGTPGKNSVKITIEGQAASAATIVAMVADMIENNGDKAEG